MNRVLLLTLLFLIGWQEASQAQRWKRYRHEAVFGLGATNFLGELGGGDGPARDLFLDTDMKASRFCISGGYRYKLNEFSSARANLTYARLYGNDALAGEIFRRSRNLHFRSALIELAAVGEIYFIREKTNSRYRVRGIKGALGTSMSAYVFGGVAGFYFNPRAQYTDGKWYSLRKLGTEGQGLAGNKKYSPVSFGIPIGIGAKFNISRTMAISLEYGFRYTFTDYIDDVSGVYYDPVALAAANGPVAAYFSNPAIPLLDQNGETVLAGGPSPVGLQRGDPNSNDTYMFAILSLNYKFVSKKTNRPKF